MNDPYSASPVIAGLLLCLGGVLMVVTSYFYMDDVPDKPSAIGTMFWLIGIGYLLWISGSIALARSRFSSIWAGLGCGILLPPGLLLLLTIVPRRTRQEVWQAANPTLTGRVLKRQYPNQKSLY
jgi:hypothetical protein